MKRSLLIFINCSVLLLSGCLGNTRLDTLTMTLTLGLDVSNKGTFYMYSSSPVFNKDAKEHTEVIQVKATSLREGRYNVDVFASGRTVGGKLQNIVIGKQLARKTPVFPLLDVMYRDPKNSTTALLIIYDGPVKELMTSKQREKPRLAVALRDLIINTAIDKQTVKVNLLDFHRMMFEKGCTPYMAEMTMKNGKMATKGVALFDSRGKYVTSLSPKESAFFHLLLKDVKPAVPITIRMPPTAANMSVSIEHGKFRYKTAYKNERFQFDLQMNVGVIITEQIANSDISKIQKQLEKLIASEIKKRTEQLIEKFQKHKIDPLGLGLYARAYEYNHWKKVKNHWGEAFAESHISISPKVKIISYGVVN
ncbi:Ger(x)C family spore germination protein [Anoxybacteroides tepidamans]|uniref:Ger(x)C family spore germination protein n=1 Tax=Anoxybacteroides tepidamans TaxID=265948 RepID=UPI000480BDBC|nr:Ger(x)C family spore germination protein [Anoxybacillus tepidamans]